MAAAKPWMKFYPRDWRADEKLRLCSYAARGLWIEMMALMHSSERYGRLLVNGKEPTIAQLALLTSGAPDECERLIDELRDAGVFSTDVAGIIYSRRMKSDEKLSENARKIGKRGGNPRLLKQKENPAGDKGELNGTLNLGDKPREQSPDSVTNVTGADGANPVDPNKIFWANAKAMLQPFCKGDPGKVIGQWLRDHGKETTTAAITAAQLEEAVNPIEYCQGYFRRNGAKAVKPAPGSDEAYLEHFLEDRRQRQEFEARQAAAGGG